MNDEKKKEKEIKRLNFENFIWIIFIVLSILDIYGDELIKKYLIQNDKKADIEAKKIFFFILIVTILIYIYFIIRNYNDYKKHDSSEYFVRLFGSILVLSGSICFLYFQIKTGAVTESLSNI